MPSAPRNVRLELEQENPPVVLVTWQQPRSTFGDVRGFRVVYGTEGQDRTERRLEPDVYRSRTKFLGEFHISREVYNPRADNFSQYFFISSDAYQYTMQIFILTFCRERFSV